MNNDDQNLGPIEIVPEAVESTGDHHYADTTVPVIEFPQEKIALSVAGLVLAFPFPILVIILWATIDAIKGQGDTMSNLTMNAVVLYLVQFFVIPVVSLTSIIIALIVTAKSKGRARTIGYVSLGVTTVGIILLAIFLNR